MKPAIEVEHLGKCYRIGRDQSRGGYRTLRESLSQAVTGPIRRLRGQGDDEHTDFWALQDVSFDVKPGEVLGIIGKNGAGKSTLLKIISRITRPTKGRARMHGRIGSLLEVGTGFHPELTGRENVFLNGAILGMSRAEIRGKFDEIVAFAGVEEFLDTPIKRYSSGMYVRLAFAVAAHLEPEILLVDEVLAVGDQAFQRKCIGRMGDIASSGRTILLVSHDLPMLSRLSHRAIWIDKGTVRANGSPTDVVAAYVGSAQEGMEAGASVSLAKNPNRRPGMSPILQRVSLYDGENRLSATVPLGGRMVVEMELQNFPAEMDTTVAINVCDMFGSSLAQAHSKVQSTIDLTGYGAARARCTIDDVRLVPGDYMLTLTVGDNSMALDRIENAIGITVVTADIYGTGKMPTRKHGPIALAARWEVEEMETGRIPMAGNVAGRGLA